MRRKAIREVRTYGAIGRCTCSLCHWRIDVIDLYCKRCGAKFVGTEYREVASARRRQA